LYCRVRPENQKELDDGDLPALKGVDSMTLEAERPCVRYNSACSRDDGIWKDVSGNKQKARYAFDGLFTSATQQEVFEECRSLMQSAFDGHSVTIIAYGQTGSGKTYTINGDPGAPGLAPQMVTEIYRIIGRDSDRFHHQVTASMVEIYRNELVDLLRKDKDEQFHNVVEEDCPDGAALVEVMARGNTFRTTGATAMNTQSSRSHLIQTVKIHRVNRSTSADLTGKIVLVDLAGSERLKKASVEGDMMKEGIDINRSLSALVDVFQALKNSEKVVPYSKHKLTQILQDSLRRSAKTLLFVHCAPTKKHLEETVRSLEYALRVKQIAPLKENQPPLLRGDRSLQLAEEKEDAEFRALLQRRQRYGRRIEPYR
jgi:kinesin family protein C2/C3